MKEKKTGKRNNTKSRQKKQEKDPKAKGLQSKIIGAAVFLVALFIMISFFAKDYTGVIGDFFYKIFNFTFGFTAFLMCLLAMILSVFLITDSLSLKKGIGLIVLALAITMAFEFFDGNIEWADATLNQPYAQYFYNTPTYGGFVGFLLDFVFTKLIGNIGVVILFIVLFLVGCVLAFDLSVTDWIKKSKDSEKETVTKKESWFSRRKAAKEAKKEPVFDNGQAYPASFSQDTMIVNGQEEIKIQTGLTSQPKFGVTTEPAYHRKRKSREEEETSFPITKEEQKREEERKEERIREEKREDTSAVFVTDITAKTDHAPYIFPPLELLKRGRGQSKSANDKIIETAKKLEDTLESFNVKAKVTAAFQGPSVTRYELQPEWGVKVSKFLNLSDDIALRLAAKTIRIEAPIPGKSAIGIEVPNESRDMVTIREIIDSKAFKNIKTNLPLTLGKDITGVPIIEDLTKMPHILIAGSTGSGKSVGLNTIITGILYKSSPAQVKMILIDPKMVEFSNYNGIPHLVSPVVTDPKQAITALNWAVHEMTRRYKLFSECGTKDILGYNGKMTSEEEKLPYIVVIIDELADLMMVAPSDVEDAIIRLAQMARAAGIHLIIATQRPSAEVITGLIKSNVPSRISFMVSSQLDSRIILDTGGAEKLLGNGDMLFMPGGVQEPIRIQGPFISEKEVESIVEFIKYNNGEARQKVDFKAEAKREEEEKAANNDDKDTLFVQAGTIIIESNQASASMLQRRLKVGYARAARIIDQLEMDGVIGPFEGNKPREVLMTLDEFHEKYLGQEE